ncbi:MAG: hypothetical protein MH321_14140 [Leptospiraceae bacterium]|nr:hypothetical protein [Leptospiraceae bacterium]
MNLLKEYADLNGLNTAQIKNYFGITYANARNWLSAETLSRTQFKRLLESFEKRVAHDQLIEEQGKFLDMIKVYYGLENDSQLASLLSVTQSYISQIKSRKVDRKSIQKLFQKSVEATSNQIIKPIIEFYGIDKSSDKFLDEKSNKKYINGIIARLKECKGIYCFFDSRGQTLYIGKATGQSLFSRMNTSYRNSAKELQLFNVQHPSNNLEYRSMEEITNRRIVNRKQTLFEAASYFSAYEVTIEAYIPVIEAMLIRCFPNNIANKRMENFPRPK